MDEVRLLQETLTAARNGGAGLVRLAEAHEIACRRRLPHTIAEIRRHIRRLVPNPDGRTSIGKDLLLGVVAGVGTHYLLKAVERGR